MKTFETEIEISATAETVWQVLVQQVPAEPVAFGILRLDGKIAKGAKIKLWSEVSPKRAFSLKVDVFDPPRQMVWRGGMPLGLFTGRRAFLIEPSQNGCRFRMREVFSGPMAGMITKSIPDLTPSFEKFARTLKLKAEQR